MPLMLTLPQLFLAGLGAGQFIGAPIGAHMVVSKGTRFIRPVFISMVLAVTARLIWQNFH